MFKCLKSIYALGPVVVASLVLSGCGSEPEADKQAAKPVKPAAAPAKPMGLPVKAVPVTVGAVVDEVSAVGTLLADESVVIRPEIDGRIASLHFTEGQAVKKGQRLVTLDSSEYEAQLAGIKAELKTERQRYVRGQELYQQKFISKEALDALAGTVDQLEAKVEEAQARVDKTVIRAPFSGTVGLREVSPGAYVKAGDDIVILENLSDIKVDFRVPEVYMSKIKRDQQVALRVDAYPGEEFKGVVYAVQPAVDKQTRTLLMRARVANQGAKLKPGMFVRVALTTSTRPKAISVPEEALWPQGKDNYVYVVVDNKVKLTKVELGNRRPGEVEIVAGLSPGDVVVTEGQIKLRDGAPVMVMGAQPAPESKTAKDGGSKAG